MKPISLQTYMHIGALHWYLVSLPPNGLAKGANSIAWTIAKLKTQLEEHDFPVTLQAGHRLWSLQQRLDSAAYPQHVQPDELKAIQAAARNLEDTLVAESSCKYTFSVTDKRLDTRKLIERPALLLAPSVYANLPAPAANDFNEACRAIAFELPTSSAFLLLRCVEAALHHYYICNIRQKRLKDSKRMWGSMVDHLRRKRTSPPPVELLDTLDRIRINFRNPTAHPDKRYDIQEAQDLFGLCVDALNRMIRSAAWQQPKSCMKSIFDTIESELASANKELHADAGES